MKKLYEYLMESAKQYVYRVKIAGDFPKENYEAIKTSLGKFDVQNCTKPKKTPIQSDPHGFPGLQNEEINIFDITLNYPANSEQIVELARQCGVEPAKIVVIGKDFNDSMNDELRGVEDGTRLETEDYPEQTKEQKKASDDYAGSFKDAAAEFANESDMEVEIAGGKTTPAKYNTDKKSGGDDSPMSKVKRKSLSELLK